MSAILFGITTLVFASLFFLLRGSIRHAKNQLKQINAHPGTNRQVHLHLPDKGLEELLVEVNKILAVKQQEQILYQKQEQEIRTQIANITHDLRTPLTSILGYLALAKEEGVANKYAKDYLDIAENRAKTLQALVSGFYDISRIEANDYPVTLQKVDLNYLIKRILADYYKEICDAGFDVTLDLQDEAHLVIADENCVMRVFTNLLQNVLKHGTASMHIFQGVQAGRYITVVSNQTLSIQPEDVPHVFERSFTADKTRTNQNTGLGLPVVKWLMEMMGYSVSAQYDSPVFSIRLDWSKRQRST